MDGNRGDAEECLNRARENLLMGNLKEAEKNVSKAEKLFPSLDGIEKFTKRIQEAKVIQKIKNSKTLYEVLDVKPDATEAEISKSFRTLSRTLHPDKKPFQAERAAKAYRCIDYAQRILRDPEQRALYDDRLSSGCNDDFLWYLFGAVGIGTIATLAAFYLFPSKDKNESRKNPKNRKLG